MANRVLLVDDEKVFLKSLKVGLDSFEDIFIVDICFSVKEAIQLIENNTYSLIITDIRMPHKTGMDLIIHLKDIDFRGGIKVMSAHRTEENIQQVKGMGIVDVISKPFDLEWFQNMIVDFFEMEKSTNVTFESIELISVLQVINIDRKTVAIQIDNKGMSGLISFKEGEIIDAEFGIFSGEKALLTIMGLEDVHISVKKIKKKVKRTIDIPFTKLMMNIMKLLDEIKLNRDKLEDNESALELKSEYDIKLDNQDSSGNGGIESLGVPNKDSVKENKEETIKSENFENAQKIMIEELGEAFIGGSFWISGDAQPLVSYPKENAMINIGVANALFDRVTAMIRKSFKESELPTQINKYYLIDLTDNMVALVVLFENFQWGVIINTNEASLGLILNVALPKAMKILSANNT